jgi:hypothetical protein
VSRSMPLKDNERRLLHEVLQEVKPYLAETQLIQELVDRHMESASSLFGFISQLVNEGDILGNDILRTDLRIFIAMLRKRTK